MSYRKITVDGTVYEWTVGKKFVKIKGMKEILLIEIGNPVYNGMMPPEQFVVSPKNIASYIRGEGIPVFTCKEHGVSVTEMTSDPYCEEINGKRIWVMNCPDCVHQSALDI